MTGLRQAAKRYRNVAQTLDFSAPTGGGTEDGSQSLEDEVNHYITSALPPRVSTDMIGYWMVCFLNFKQQSTTYSNQYLESWENYMAQDILPLRQLCTYPGHFCAF